MKYIKIVPTIKVKCELSQMNNLTENNLISKFIWILSPHITPDMKQLYIPVNCQFIRLTSIRNSRGYVLTEMYRTSAESLMYTDQLGTWDKVQRLKTSADSFLQRRSDFFRQPLALLDTYRVSISLVTY